MVREESQRPVRNQVFFSYSHKDKKWLERFQTMLKPVMRGDMLMGRHEDCPRCQVEGGNPELACVR